MSKIEYRIGTIENKYPESESVIDFDIEINSQQYEILDNSLLYLEKLRMLFNIFLFLELNYDDFNAELNKSVSTYLEKIEYWNGFKNDDIEIINVNLNRLFLNY